MEKKNKALEEYVQKEKKKMGSIKGAAK